jgi:DNA polymerase III alpha subunit
VPELDRFVHLHSHSFFSYLDGLNDPYTLVRAAGHLGQPALALTDHGTLRGVAEFLKAIKWYNEVHSERHEFGKGCAKNGCHSTEVCLELERCPKKERTTPGEAHATIAPFRGIIGIETYVAHNGRDTRIRGDAGHLILLAKNKAGWDNLRVLASRAETEGFYENPRVDMEMLAEHREGLIALSSCLGGHLADVRNWAIDAVIDAHGGDKKSAAERESSAATRAAEIACDEVIARYRDLFGEDYFLEVQWHNDQDPASPGKHDQWSFNQFLIAASDRTGVPLVLTNDSHHAFKADAPLEEILFASQIHMPIDQFIEARRTGKIKLGFDTPDFYLKSRHDMNRAMGDWLRTAETHDPALAERLRAEGSTWMLRTLDIAERVEVYEPFRKGPHWPIFDIPDEYLDESIADVTERRAEGSKAYLAKRVWDKVGGRYPDMTDRQRRLIEYELQCINDLGFAPYFLITEDFVDYARQEDIEVGIGRGSAPGSVITYVLGITDLDPILFRLTEDNIGLTRFLNPTVNLSLDADVFGALPPDIAALEAPDADQMRADISAIIRERRLAREAALDDGSLLNPDTGVVCDEARLAFERKRWPRFKRLLKEEWDIVSVSRDWEEGGKSLHTYTLLEPFWRALQAQAAGHGPGERNAAHSILASFLDISTERVRLVDAEFLPFLPRYHFSHSRIGMPDIDIDFEPHDKHSTTPTGRAKVIAYVRDKYGADHVAQIATMGKYHAASAIKDVGRAKGMLPARADELTGEQYLPKKFRAQVDDDTGEEVPGVSLREMLTSTHPAVVSGFRPLRELMAQDPMVDDVIRTAARLEGVARGKSTHACGVLITPEPVVNYVPIERTKGDSGGIQAVFDGPTLDEMGLLKEDFLGLKNLTINKLTVQRIKERRGIDVDWRRPPLDDPATMKLFRDGKALGGIFQFNTSFAVQILRDIAPRVVGDLAIATALGRPGPMEYIPAFIAARAKGHGTYGDPGFEKVAKSVLEETFGILVFQEQVMRLSIRGAGFTLTESDKLRKATAKKDAEKLESLREHFVEGTVANGVSKSFIERYWNDVLTPFASYSFNRSHAAAYSYLAYDGAYLMAHYAEEFEAARMTVEQSEGAKGKGKLPPLAEAVAEVRRIDMDVMPVNINTSTKRIEILADKVLQMSLLAPKKIGPAPVEAIIAERAAGGPFTSFRDFVARMMERERAKNPETGRVTPLLVNAGVVDMLIKVGAFDIFDERAHLLAIFAAWNGTKSVKKRALIDWSPLPPEQRPVRTPFEYLAWEKAGLEFQLSPVAACVDDTVGVLATDTVADLYGMERARDSRDMPLRSMLGVVSSAAWVGYRNKPGGRITMNFDDGLGTAKTIFFPPKDGASYAERDAYAAFRAAVEDGSINNGAVLFKGRFENNERYGHQFLVSEWQPVVVEHLPMAAVAAATIDVEDLKVAEVQTAMFKPSADDVDAALDAMFDEAVA